MSHGSRKPYERPSSPGRADRGAWVHDKAPRFDADSGVGQPNQRLVVTNLHYELQEKDLARIFGVIGELAREPVIRYDRSGRSTGTAYIAYNSAPEAMRAKEQLDGVTAKGEQMRIAFDNRPPPGGAGGRRGKLIDRIGDGFESGPGPIRTRGVGRGRDRVARGGGRGRGGRGRGGTKDTPDAKSLADLDKELEAFMGGGNKGTGQTKSAEDANVLATEDVTMA